MKEIVLSFAERYCSGRYRFEDVEAGALIIYQAFQEDFEQLTTNPAFSWLVRCVSERAGWLDVKHAMMRSSSSPRSRRRNGFETLFWGGEIPQRRKTQQRLHSSLLTGLDSVQGQVRGLVEMFSKALVLVHRGGGVL